eukprot:2360153-Amphidinium_carterae.1
MQERCFGPSCFVTLGSVLHTVLAFPFAGRVAADTVTCVPGVRFDTLRMWCPHPQDSKSIWLSLSECFLCSIRCLWRWT